MFVLNRAPLKLSSYIHSVSFDCSRIRPNHESCTHTMNNGVVLKNAACYHNGAHLCSTEGNTALHAIKAMNGVLSVPILPSTIALLCSR